MFPNLYDGMSYYRPQGEAFVVDAAEEIRGMGAEGGVDGSR